MIKEKACREGKGEMQEEREGCEEKRGADARRKERKVEKCKQEKNVKGGKGKGNKGKGRRKEKRNEHTEGFRCLFG